MSRSQEMHSQPRTFVLSKSIHEVDPGRPESTPPSAFDAQEQRLVGVAMVPRLDPSEDTTLIRDERTELSRQLCGGHLPTLTDFVIGQSVLRPALWIAGNELVGVSLPLKDKLTPTNSKRSSRGELQGDSGA